MASRKRARTEDIPSSSTPAPLLVTVGQDVQSSQTLVPMLQSLFRGQFIIMHSLQELAHNRPIITMKHFLEQVAWSELNFHWWDPTRLLRLSPHLCRLIQNQLTHNLHWWIHSLLLSGCPSWFTNRRNSWPSYFPSWRNCWSFWFVIWRSCLM